MVVCTRSTWESEAGGFLLVWGKPRLQSELQDSQVYVERPCLKGGKSTEGGREGKRREKGICIQTDWMLETDRQTDRSHKDGPKSKPISRNTHINTDGGWDSDQQRRTERGAGQPADQTDGKISWLSTWLHLELPWKQTSGHGCEEVSRLGELRREDPA